MATFSLGFTDHAGKVKFFGEKFQVMFNSKDNADTVSISSHGNPNLPQKQENPYADYMNKEISMDEYNERLINDIDTKIITDPEYDNLMALLEKESLNYDLNLKLLRDGNTVA